METRQGVAMFHFGLYAESTRVFLAEKERDARRAELLRQAAIAAEREETRQRHGPQHRVHLRWPTLRHGGHGHPQHA